MKKILPLCVLFSFLYHIGYTQNPQTSKTDSLFAVLKSQKADTAKVNTLNAIAYQFRNNDPDTTLYFANKAFALAEQLNFKEGLAEAHLNKGSALANLEEFEEALKNDSDAINICDVILSSENPGSKMTVLKLKKRACTAIGNMFFYQGNYPEALKIYSVSLKISEETGDKRGVAALYGNIASIYFEEGNYPLALKTNFASLKLWEELGMKKDIAKTYNHIGSIYSALGNYSEALKMDSVYLKIGEETGDAQIMIEAYNNIGGVYLQAENYSAAIENLSASLKISKENKDYKNVGNTYSNIGNVYLAQDDYTEALKNYFAALEIQERMEAKPGLVSTYVSMGNVYTKLGKYNDALSYLDKGLALSKKIGSLESIKNAYEGLSDLENARGNYKQSLEHYKMYVSYRDSLFNEDITRKTVQSQMQYDFDKKETEAKAAQDKKDALTSAEISKQKIVRNFTIAGSLGVLFLGGYMFYNFRRRKRLESLHALSNERLRISRELHDDIGSTLGSIAVYSDVAKNRSLKNGNPSEVLSKIGTASRELIEKMSDIVWSLNPENETFDQLQGRMQAFAAMILTPQDIVFEFKNDGDLKTVMLTNEQRKNIFLIYKEAIHNIVKYAGCKNVLIAFSKLNNRFSFSIKDDGKGFDAVSFEEGRGEAYNGNGLKNMKTRAADMNASIAITSRSNEGTAIVLELNS
ncbi:MAG: tetratricopeptide repeat protein [Bacteroidia bacterium]